MKAAALWVAVFGSLLGGCDSTPAPAPKQTVPKQPAASNLIHSPPIKLLTDEQLRSLSMRCEKYVPENSARGPYDAAYCEDAIAAWADAPLQMMPMRPADGPIAPGPRADGPNEKR